MIILVFGKSGTGKSYLSKKLANDLKGSIHIDLDQLNSDLMKTDDAINFAKDLFGKDVVASGKISKEIILNAISSDPEIRGKWVEYMKGLCTDFLTKYIAATHFDYYILDHIIANTLQLNQPAVLVECICDEATRLSRLQARDNITAEQLNFRDSGYITTPANLTYDSTNYAEILSSILSL